MSNPLTPATPVTPAPPAAAAPGRVAKRNSHCSWCGHPFADSQPWPRTCAGCGQASYLNPIPVAVVLVPVGGGLLMVRRGIPPQVGLLALPGGFIELGETWQEAGAREVREELGVGIDPATVRDFRVLSAPDGPLLVFGLAAPLSAGSLPPFVPSPEARERVILEGPQELAFPLHTLAANEYFAGRPGR